MQSPVSPGGGYFSKDEERLIEKLEIPVRRRRITGYYEKKADELDLFNKYGDYRLFYKNDDKLCPIFHSLKYEKVKSGKQNAVGLPTKFPGYAVKEIEIPAAYTIDIESITFRDLSTALQDNPKLLKEYVVEENGVKFFIEDRVVVSEHTFVTKDEIRVLPVEGSFDGMVEGKETWVIPPKSIIDHGGYSEVYIAMTMSEVYQSGENIHIMDALMSAFCKSKKVTKTYLLFERIEYAFNEVLKCVAPYVDLYMIQILAALVSIQKARVVHGDLHYGNVFLQKTRTDGDKPTGTHLWGDFSSVTSFSYVVHGTDDTKPLILTIPYTPYIAKIGDWGYSSLFRDDIRIINASAITTGVVIFWWDPCYDVLTILKYMTLFKSTKLLDKIVIKYCATDFELKMLQEDYKTNFYLFTQIKKRFNAMFEKEYNRPIMSRPVRELSAIDILTDEWIMGPWIKSKVPKNSMVMARL